MKINIKKLNLLLAKHMLTKQDLCSKSNLSHKSIENIYKGKLVAPKTAGKLANGLGVPVTEIIEIEE